MAFGYEIVGYECTDTAKIHPMEVHPNTKTVSGTSGTVINSSLSVKISKNTRERGIRPRCIILVRTITAGNESGKKYARVPIATQAKWDSLKENAKITYNGKEWTIERKEKEDVD